MSYLSYFNPYSYFPSWQAGPARNAPSIEEIRKRIGVSGFIHVTEKDVIYTKNKLKPIPIRSHNIEEKDGVLGELEILFSKGNYKSVLQNIKKT